MASFKDQLLAPDFGFVNLTREIRSALFAPYGKVA